MRIVNRLSWVFYFVGIALIAGSYLNLVSASVGWIGWGMGMCGWLVGRFPGVRRPGTTEQISQLAKLHAGGELTDEQFEAAKAKLLRPTKESPEPHDQRATGSDGR